MCLARRAQIAENIILCNFEKFQKKILEPDLNPNYPANLITMSEAKSLIKYIRNIICAFKELLSILLWPDPPIFTSTDVWNYESYSHRRNHLEIPKKLNKLLATLYDNFGRSYSQKTLCFWPNLLVPGLCPITPSNFIKKKLNRSFWVILLTDKKRNSEAHRPR